MPEETYVIVGASLAGASAATALRKEGFEGRVVLIGEETERPYERPELSKKYLRGEKDSPKWVQPEAFYADANIELLSGERATAIEPDRREVRTTERTVSYDRLLIATWATPRRLDLPGADLDGVVTLRTVRDSDAIRERAQAARSVAVVGGGWIGSEVAASLRQIGTEVTLVSLTDAPLEHVLGPEVADVYRRAHQDRGVQLVTGAKVAWFSGASKVDGVVTEDGRSIAADLVVVGVGAEPRTELAEGAGLIVDGGLVVDAHLATNVPDIYAAGDVANAWHPFYRRRMRIEHWDNAKRQGRTAGANMAGQATPYDRIPYFYSDQYDLGMEYTGHAAPTDEVLFRGDPRSGEFIAFWLNDGRVSAGMNVNIWDVAPAIEGLIRSGRPVDRERLADLDAPIEDAALATV
jgi:3-phenylpropionate/trans-cinnamate dioxygenase ferredoxin reductase component